MMNTNKKTPKLRFKGFTDDWEQRKLTSFIQRVKGNDGRMDLPTLTISASEGWLNQKDRFSANIAGSEQKNYTLLRQGELSYNHGNSKLAKYGVVYVLKDYKEALVPRVYHSFKVDESYDALFVEYYFSTKRPDRELAKLVSSGARMDGLLNIGYDEFTNISIAVPTFSEQRQIVALLRRFDKFITLHQRKLEKLKLNKSALLQKLFPQDGCTVPEIRFKGFTDDWEQRKFCDVMRFINGRAYKQDELLGAGKYKVLRVGNFYTNDSWYYSNLELDDKYYAMNGDLLYTWSATFGPHIWNGEKVIYHYHIWKLVLQNNIDKLFALQLLEVDKANIMSDKNGSTMVHITKQGMEKKQTILPMNLNEQKQIARFLSSMDKFINLHQRKLDRLMSIKKALLQQLFV